MEIKLRKENEKRKDALVKFWYHCLRYTKKRDKGEARRKGKKSGHSDVIYEAAKAMMADCSYGTAT